MKELTNSQKLEVIKSKVKELDLTSYFIAQRTNLGEKGIKNILDGKVKRPHSSTLNELLKFLDNYQEEMYRKNSVYEDESTGEDDNDSITAESLIAKKVLDNLEPVLRRIKNTQELSTSTTVSNAYELQHIRESLEEMNQRFSEMNKQLKEMHEIMTSKK